MKDIFTDLYKKVVGFFQQDTKTDEDSAKNAACNRLKLVLMQDRTNLTPYLLERMRGEMIEVLSKYVEMDKDALELNFEQEGEQMALMLSIPVLRAKEEDEINAVIKAEEEAKKEKEAKAEEIDDPCEGCDCEYKDSDMTCDECPKVETCECVAEDKCTDCDCEYKETDMLCENCPKVETCECVIEDEDPCADCDCEYKDSDTDCEECPKAETCECKEEIDACKKEAEKELEKCDCGEEECDCDENCDENCTCSCHDKDNKEKTKSKKNKKK